MQFSDTTNKNGIIQECEDACALGDAGISGQATLLKQFTAKVNNTVSEIWSWIFQSYGGWTYDDSNQTDLPESTTNLVAGQSKYALASNMLTINRVEVTDSAGNVVRATPLPQEHVEHIGLSTFSSVLGSSASPQFYRVTDGIIELFPTPSQSVTDGLAVYFERDSVQFASTDTTKTPGFASPFHRLVPVGTSIRWYKIKQPNSATLKELKEEWAKGEEELRAYYTQRWRDYRPKLNPPAHNWN